MTDALVSGAVLLLSTVALSRTGVPRLGPGFRLEGRRRAASTQAAVLPSDQVLADAIELKQQLDAQAFATYQAMQRMAGRHGLVSGDE